MGAGVGRMKRRRPVPEIEGTLQIATVILGIAALGGMALAGMRLSGMPRPPTWMAVGHGLVAVAGFGTLVAAALSGQIPVLAQIALGVFAIAALGGLVLFLGFHLRQLPLPIPFVVVHGLVALTGFILLVISISQS
jgi:hypothetical protein